MLYSINSIKTQRGKRLPQNHAQGRPKGRLFLYRESGWDIIREKRVEGFYENRKQRDATV